MKRVWFVTEGSYSDYRVLHTFTNRADAEKYAESKSEDGWDSREVEPDNDEGYPLIEELPEPVELRTMSVHLFEEGKGTNYQDETRLLYPGLDFQPEACRSTAYPHVYNLNNKHIFVEVKGTDTERVAKVFSEVVARNMADWALIIETEERKRYPHRNTPRPPSGLWTPADQLKWK